MRSATTLPTPTPITEPAVLGAAIFDLNGLPKEYFTTAESFDIGWIQTIFQALGLQSLLLSSLQLEGFSHAVVGGSTYQAIVVRQKQRYTALLLQKDNGTHLDPDFVKWVQDIKPEMLKNDQRFQSI
ncbi:MAG: hypothetical protein HC881_12395 [Leptolyngbyaceae cyanobacterium SL_7_1]|nr:hypothetical protein [Leptolyngbyaceae cyanobacterium SL_7_1]